MGLFKVDDRLRLAAPAKTIGLALADVRHQRRAEARQAGAAFAAHARIQDAQRSRLEQAFAERLRLDVARRVQTIGERWRLAEIVKLAAEIGQVVVERHLLLEASD